MFIIARRSKSNLLAHFIGYILVCKCSSLQGDRSQIFWLILLDTYSYVNVHHCKAIEVKSWLILLDTYSYVNVHHCKAIEVKSWLISLDTYSYVNVHHCKAIEVKSFGLLAHFIGYILGRT